MTAAPTAASDLYSTTRTAEHSRILVLMARFVGAGFVAYFLISITQFGQPAGMVAPWYTPVAIALGFGPGFALLAVTFTRWADVWIPRLAVLIFVGYVVASLLWFIAWTGAQASVELICWLANFSGLPAMALSLVRRLRDVVLSLLVCALLAGTITVLGRSADVPSNLFSDLMWAFVFTLPFALAARVVVRTGAILDETRADAMQAVGESAAAAARNSERARFDAIIHDHVIGTLVAANANPDDDRLVGQARAALDELVHAETAGVETDRPLTEVQALALLRTAAVDVDADVPVGVDREVNGGDERPADEVYPPAAVRAMAEALGEALRNSFEHAGPEAERVVLIRLGADLLSVTVADNGVGFSPSSVPPERLGISVSIRQRMHAQPGGSASVVSAPGKGTTVSIAWERER